MAVESVCCVATDNVPDLDHAVGAAGGYQCARAICG